ncbi:MAG TPA: prolipoprotein diacylglyceryl transferase family protein, partial [Sphaerochaeta sp.]|nr:prolipoprotein diacylglyceryl transferase family protein [Sphaerochaeta sp.]
LFSTNYEWVRTLADKLDIPYVAGSLINLPRHPSQLYEALFEGIVLFVIMWFVIRPRRERQPYGFALSSYLILYGSIRFVIEYFRAPDANLGYILAWGAESDNIALFQSFFNISMGQLFCLAMIAAGLALYLVVRKIDKRA